MSSLHGSLASTFFQRALVEAILVGLIGGLVGVHVVLRRLSFFVSSLSHATFPGAVVASVVGVSVYVGTAAAGLGVAAAVLFLGAKRLVDETNIIGVVLAGAFAFGVVLMTARPHPTKDLTAFLVGSILTVNAADLVVAAITALLVVLILWFLGKELVFGAFDVDAATAMGYRRWALDGVALGLIVLTVMVSIPAVGALLSLAMLTIPALSARLWVDRVGPMSLLAACLGVVSGVVGLGLSALWAIAAGPAIALVAVVIFLISVTAHLVGRG